MRILHVNQRTSCIRGFKQARIMLERGHQVESVAQTHGFGFNIYTLAYSWADEKQLAAVISESKADVIHVHSQPDWLVAFAKKHAGSRPVVMDVHDPESLRTCQPPDANETEAFKAADGIIHVSEPCRAYCEKLHGAGKPTELIYSYVNGNFYNRANDVNWTSICYEGGMTTRTHDENGHVYYRNYTYPVQKFIEGGYNVSLFAVGYEEINATYEGLGALVVRDLHYTTMLNAVRNHAFGLVGAAASVRLMHAAMPNKLFEYISQGVVPVVWNADTAGEFVTRHGIGIWLKDDELDDLPAKLSRGPACRKNLLNIRDKWRMETQAETLEKFYQTLL